MNKKYLNVSIESLMVILLMIFFASAICVLIIEGSRTYEAILSTKEIEENQRIAFSYVSMRIKQNDQIHSIHLEEEGFNHETILVIDHHHLEEGLHSYIYFDQGYLLECYTDGPLDPSLSTPIIPISPLSFDYGTLPNQIRTTITTPNQKLVLYNTLRSTY